jgi:hypothetical protein
MYNLKRSATKTRLDARFDLKQHYFIVLQYVLASRLASEKYLLFLKPNNQITRMSVLLVAWRLVK